MNTAYVPLGHSLTITTAIGVAGGCQLVANPGVQPNPITPVAPGSTIVVNASATDSIYNIYGSGATYSVAPGNWTTPNPPTAFQVYLSLYQTIADSTLTKIAFDTVAFDASNFFNTTTHVFLPTIAGYYYIYCSYLYNEPVPLNTLVSLDLQVNDVSVSQVLGGCSSTTFGGFAGVFGGAIVKLNGTTDYASPAAKQFSGGNLLIYPTPIYSYFGGILMERT